jgi:hydroxymethylpyrimidine pyrophosphatase-like HAD family hydrolase
MEYKLIAFDMDGTLLNSNKQISKKTQEAIARAVAHNKIVILNTGRNLAELKQTIVVGDAGNDVEALKVAGLAVVMDNAIDEIKQYGDVIVSDCDHDGCVEAIEKYLLKE